MCDLVSNAGINKLALKQFNSLLRTQQTAYRSSERSVLVHSLAVFSDPHSLSRCTKQILAVTNLVESVISVRPGLSVCETPSPRERLRKKKEELFNLGRLSGKICCVTRLNLLLLSKVLAVQ